MIKTVACVCASYHLFSVIESKCPLFNLIVLFLSTNLDLLSAV